MRPVYDWNAIRDCYEAGATVRECQARFGFSNGAWHRAVERGDVNPRTRERPPGRTRQRVAELLAEGLSKSEIARVLAISKPTVSYHAQKARRAAGDRAGAPV